MKKEMTILAIMALFVLCFAMTACEEDDDDCIGDDCDSDSDDDTGGGDGDADTDTDGDTDADSDSDSDSDTDSDTEDYCECLKNGDGPDTDADPEEGEYCFDIQGAWTLIPDNLPMNITSVSEETCSTTPSGQGAAFAWAISGEALPLKYTDVDDGVVFTIYTDGETLFLKKTYSSAPDDFDVFTYIR